VGIATAVGIALVVVGAALIMLSHIPIPTVEVVQKTKPIEGIGWAMKEETIVDRILTLTPGDFFQSCFELNREATVKYEIRVITSSDSKDRQVGFWVMDEPEVRVFKSGGAFQYYPDVSKGRVVEASGSWNPPVGRMICFVVENTFTRTASKTVYVKITAAGLIPTLTTTYTTVYEREVTTKTLTELLLPGIVLLVVGIGVAVGGALARRAPPQHYPTGYI